MPIKGAGAARELTASKGKGARPSPSPIIRDTKAQSRRQSVLATGMDEIYEQYRPRVYSWCLRITRNVEDAEDFTQDAFLLLFRKINTYRGESAFSTWFYRLATNVVLMRMRRKTLPQTPLDEILESHQGAINPRDELKTSDRHLAASVARVDLERMFDQMPSGYRKAFFLHDGEDYSHPEIAALTGWSIGTSKSQLHRARRQLRKLLERGHRKASLASTGRRSRAGKMARWSAQAQPNASAVSVK